MAEFYIDPPDIIADFLRANLTDPRARAENSQSDNVTASAGQTEIILTAPSGNVSAITELTVEGTEQIKWGDYFWDYQNQKITFFTALSLNDAVIITYKYGSTNWIYSGRPVDQVKSTNFPRIGIFTVSSRGKRLGRFNAPVETLSALQLDVWAKDKYVATIDSRKYTGKYLTRYIGNRITRAFDNNAEDLHPVLYDDEQISGPRDAPYSDEYQAEHSIIEMSVKTLKSGRIEV